MRNQPLVFLIVPIHNGLKDTIKCLDNTRRLTYSNLKTIVVDDGSTDGSHDYITKHFPEVILLKGDGNLWWSGSVNKGVKYGLKNQGDYICLLNNDNTFKNNFLSVLIETAEKMDIQAVCSKVYYKKSDVVFFGGASRNKWGELLILDGSDCKEFNVEKRVDWLTGMGVLINREVFRDIGLFDEKNFPQYYGDSDFGLRMVGLGYEILYQPKSVIYNDYESTGFSFYKRKLKNLYRTLFSIKSVNNIKICFRFYRKHSPKYVIIITFKLIIRVFYSYFRTVFTKKSKFDLKKNK